MSILHRGGLVVLTLCTELAVAGSLDIPALRRTAPESNPSPIVGGSTSQRTNQMADAGMYKAVEYANVDKKGPNLVVLPGEVKSNDTMFARGFLPNKIADYAELELTKANFGVLERTNLGPLLPEFELAYNLGDVSAARKMLQRGHLRTTRWVVRFDVLKAEPVAAAVASVDGKVIGGIIGILGPSGKSGAVAEKVANSVQTKEGSAVWVVGIRYKIFDANTTERFATGYLEEKMEVGAGDKSVVGFSSAATGGLTLDGLVQRLVQKSVAEIDGKHK
jgi:hypothetical protein